MYEWIKKVENVIKTVKGKPNNYETRSMVTDKIIDILNKAGVVAFVDCGPNYNNAEVIHHGEFRAMVDLKTVQLVFKYINEEVKK